METKEHTSARAFINRHAVLTFYILVFALVWGLPFIIIMIAGPLFIAGAGILVIALAYGRVGLRDLRSRLFRWQVGVRWYAVALLTYPLLMTAILFPFWLTSKSFRPDMITAEDKASRLVA